MRFIPRITRRRCASAALLTMLLLAGWASSSFYVAYRLTHRAKPAFAEPVPETAWANWKPVQLTTKDGYLIGAWHTQGEATKPVMLLLHGNGAARGATLPLAKQLAPAGYSLLAISLRAHGDSSGETNDFGRSAAADVVAAVEYLEQTQPGVPIVIRGSSLGAAAAIFAAPSLKTRVAGYVLECPYTDIYTAVRNRTRNNLPPVVDQMAYAGLVLMAPFVLENPEGISPLSHAQKFPAQVPVLIMAGGRDRHATLAEAKALQQAIGPTCQLTLIKEGQHGKLQACDPQGYESCLLSFLRQLESEQLKLKQME